MKKRIVLCGQSSFAARGLCAQLTVDGHHVVCFGRSANQANDCPVITGPVDQMHTNLQFEDYYDTLINFTILKDEPAEQNCDYLRSLLRFCHTKGITHLIQISSLSVAPGKARCVDEETPVESVPERKGSYGAIKVASDLFLLENRPDGLSVSFVRPGFILGDGLIDPIVGMALRTPWNRLLLLGAASNTVPITTREKLHECLRRIVGLASGDEVASYLVVDSHSPTRQEYLQFLAHQAGFGVGVLRLPIWLWYGAGVAGDIVARSLRMQIRPYRTIRNACRQQSFDLTRTSQQLGVDQGIDWKPEVLKSLQGQTRNFRVPGCSIQDAPLRAKSVGFIGFGRIVQTRHLAALRQLGFSGPIFAYDVEAHVRPDGQRVDRLDDNSVRAADLYVVATPGPLHAKAVDHLQHVDCPVLVEKPVACGRSDFEVWQQFATSRTHPVFVCHNYRFKSNVRAMLRHLKKFNPGRLLRVSVTFQSPPVALDGAAWLRKERESRTLLLDYALHFLDLACLFAHGDWTVHRVDCQRNARGETETIIGHVACDTYSVDFLLRQGAIPRQTQLTYVFQNYSVRLGFFPETFVPHMTHHNSYLLGMEKRRLTAATMRKVVDKLRGTDRDESHSWAIRSAVGQSGELGESLRLDQLASFYNVLFELADHVYGAD